MNAPTQGRAEQARTLNRTLILSGVALLVLLLNLTGCRETYVVGVVPVFTEENREDPGRTFQERWFVELGYREAIKESRRFNRTKDPLYLQYRRYSYGWADPSMALDPALGSMKHVRQFYADHYFSKDRAKVVSFMIMNGVNLLVMSEYQRERTGRGLTGYRVTLEVVNLIQGGKDKGASECRAKTFVVPGLEDYELLRSMSKDALMGIMDQIEASNRF